MANSSRKGIVGAFIGGILGLFAAPFLGWAGMWMSIGLGVELLVPAGSDWTNVPTWWVNTSVAFGFVAGILIVPLCAAGGYWLVRTPSRNRR